MSRWNLTWLLGFTATTLVGLSLTFSAPSRDGALEKKHENIKLVVDVLEEVQQKYVKELDADKMRELVENMVAGGLERLDPHSSFINAEEYKQFQKQSKGKFGGIGIRLRTDQLVVDTPMIGTPAYEAGIQSGDRILKVDGKDALAMPQKDVINMIQGEPGTKVTLTIKHESSDKVEDVEITRAEIKMDSVTGNQRMKDNLKEWDFWIDPLVKIGYVRITSFSETTTAELTKVVDALQQAGMKGLVIDLRGNPGGLLRTAVDVSSLFLEEGKNIVTTKGRGGEKEDVYNAKRPDPNVKPGTYYPIAVLINNYSASASEIVASALQDHLRAIIIGERTYGKGSVQNVIAMEGGTSALKLTTASYWRPSGRNIHRFPDSKEEDDWGVKPSKGYEVKLSDEERAEFRRWMRDRDIVKRPGKEETKKENGKEKKEFHDRALDKAVEYVRGEIKKNDGAQAPAIGQPVPGAGPLQISPPHAQRTEGSERLAIRPEVGDERRGGAAR